LPRKIKNLRMLRHIDLLMSRNSYCNVCRLRCMPKDIGLLTDLRTLSRFVVSHRSTVSVGTHRGGIAELANLNNLHGELLISNLHHVEGVQDAALQIWLPSSSFKSWSCHGETITKKLTKF